MITEQRNHGNGGSASGMEMGNSSQVSTRSDSVISNYLVMYCCSKYKDIFHLFRWKWTLSTPVMQLLSSSQVVCCVSS